MPPTLYYLPPSPPCRAVLLLGKLLGIDFDLKAVNIQEGEHLKAEFVEVRRRIAEELYYYRITHESFIVPPTTQLNPQHCIPTLDDNELVLWESRVILTYLASMYGGTDDKLYPKDVRIRALVDQRLHFDLGTLYQRTFEYFVSGEGVSPE